MGNTTFNYKNAQKPAPRWWRKLEDGLLMILIPATVGILTGIKWKDPEAAARWTLYINTGLVAVIKFVGRMLANGEEYVQSE